MASATSSHAGDAALGGRSESYARRSGIRLQYIKCVHFYVQENVGNNTDVVFQNRGKGQIVTPYVESLSKDWFPSYASFRRADPAFRITSQLGCALALLSSAPYYQFNRRKTQNKLIFVLQFFAKTMTGITAWLTRLVRPRRQSSTYCDGSLP